MSDDGDERFIIVGIGASAGGLSAIKQLLPGLPQDPNMAYLIVVSSTLMPWLTILWPRHGARLLSGQLVGR